MSVHEGLVAVPTMKKEIKDRIIRALARREHSRYELKVKMLLKSYDEDLIDGVLEDLEIEGLVSDERFAEAYCYHRSARGFGPARIASELKERQVSLDIIDAHLDESDSQWYEAAAKQREKKFGRGKIENFSQKAKQMKFLQNRGFNHDQITHAINRINS